MFSPSATGAQDLQAGRARRDEGVALVDANSEEWRQRARALLMEVIPFGWEGISEDIRMVLIDAGLSEPHSPNCWGSLTLWAVKQNLLVPTGALQNMRDPRSHARYTKVYRRI